MQQWHYDVSMRNVSALIHLSKGKGHTHVYTYNVQALLQGLCLPSQAQWRATAMAMPVNLANCAHHPAAIV